MTEQAKLYLLRIYHNVIRSQLKYSIGSKIHCWQNCGTSQITARSVWLGLLIWQNPFQQFQFSSNPDLEPNHGFGTISNTIQMGKFKCFTVYIKKCTQKYIITISNEGYLHIIQLLLNLPSIVLTVLCVFEFLPKVLHCQLGSWDRNLPLLSINIMSSISQTKIAST